MLGLWLAFGKEEEVEGVMAALLDLRDLAMVYGLEGGVGVEGYCTGKGKEGLMWSWGRSDVMDEVFSEECHDYIVRMEVDRELSHDGRWLNDLTEGLADGSILYHFAKAQSAVVWRLAAIQKASRRLVYSTAA